MIRVQETEEEEEEEEARRGRRGRRRKGAPVIWVPSGRKRRAAKFFRPSCEAARSNSCRANKDGAGSEQLPRLAPIADAMGAAI